MNNFLRPETNNVWTIVETNNKLPVYMIIIIITVGDSILNIPAFNFKTKRS